MEKLPLFKIRCSAIYSIMAGSVGATQAQREEQIALLKRKDDARNGVLNDKGKPTAALTEKMEETLRELTAKISAKPELPAGAKSYVEAWLKEQLYARRKEFTSKQTDKGNKMEDGAIEYASDFYGWGLVTKNIERISNGFIEGTPDLLLKLSVEDTKCSWDCFTFPLFEDLNTNIAYWWQLQGYMALARRERAGLVYVLMSAPDDMVETEARRQAWKLYNSSEIPLSLFEEVKKQMSYDDLPAELRIKRYEFVYNNEAMLEVVERVKMCREYISDVLLKKPAMVKYLERLGLAA